MVEGQASGASMLSIGARRVEVIEHPCSVAPNAGYFNASSGPPEISNARLLKDTKAILDHDPAFTH